MAPAPVETPSIEAAYPAADQPLTDSPMVPNAPRNASFNVLKEYPLKRSTIFDSGSNKHIANDLKDFTPGTYRALDYLIPLYAGDSILYIQGYRDRII